MIQFVVDFLSIPEFLKSVGWMFAVAMFIGGVAFRRQKSFMLWTGVTVVFLTFQEWLRFIYFSNSPGAGEYTGRPLVFTLLAGGIFFIGLVVGMALVWTTKKHAEKQMENELEVLKQNGYGDIVETVKNGKTTNGNGNGANGGKVVNQI